MSDYPCKFCGAMPNLVLPGQNPSSQTITHAYDESKRVHCPGQLGFGPGPEGEIHRMHYESWWLSEYGPRGLQNSLNDIRESGT